MANGFDEKMTRPARRKRPPRAIRFNAPTCPFRVDEDGRRVDPKLAAGVTSRPLEASQLSHRPCLFGRRDLAAYDLLRVFGNTYG